MIFPALADLLLPRSCAVCSRKLLPFEKRLCTSCLAGLPETYYWKSRMNPMATLLNGRILQESGDDVPPFVQAVALYFYEGDYKKITRSLKYDALPGPARLCGRILGGILADCADYKDIDCIVPVPLHPLRSLSRGYNQAEVIARALAEAFPSAALRPLLSRSRYTRSQARLDPGRKARNVEGAFSVKSLDFLPGHILVVDDVCTTGSTLCECYRALWSALKLQYGIEKASAVRISFACLAFAGKSVDFQIGD